MSAPDIQFVGRLSGWFVIGVSATYEWLTLHGLTDAMVWIALGGLCLQVLTSVPGLIKSWDSVRDRFRK